MVRNDLRWPAWHIDPRGRTLRGRSLGSSFAARPGATQSKRSVLASSRCAVWPGRARSCWRPRRRRGGRRAHPTCRSSRDCRKVLVDQRLTRVGTLSLAETLVACAAVSRGQRFGDVEDTELSRALTWARDADVGGCARRVSAGNVYRKAGKPLSRCGEPLRSRGLGDPKTAPRTGCPRVANTGSAERRDRTLDSESPPYPPTGRRLWPLGHLSRWTGHRTTPRPPLPRFRGRGYLCVHGGVPERSNGAVSKPVGVNRSGSIPCLPPELKVELVPMCRGLRPLNGFRSAGSSIVTMKRISA